MNNTFKDFSALKKLKPKNDPAPQVQPKVEAASEDRNLNTATNSQDYFSALLGNKNATNDKSVKRTQQHTVVTPGTISRVREEQATLAFDQERKNLLSELADQKAAMEELARELVDAEDARDEAIRQKETSEVKLATINDELTAANSELATANSELAAANNEIERLKALLIEAQRTSLSSSVLLDKPAGIGEKFSGEIREHILETLRIARDAAENSGQERRSRLLEAVLCTNIPSGELEKRRRELKQLVIEEGNAINTATIAKLERLGFKYISGKNHHKLDWAGHRYIIAKTPSDHRAAQNSAADICNRIF